jgi:hypothetical protein
MQKGTTCAFGTPVVFWAPLFLPITGRTQDRLGKLGALGTNRPDHRIFEPASCMVRLLLRCQAETPLIVLCKFPRSALSVSCAGIS